MDKFKIFYQLTDKDKASDVPGKFIKKPQIVDIVEFDGVQLKTPEKLSYFQFPQRTVYPLDLNAGIENYKFRTSSKYRLSKVCRYLMNNAEGYKENISKAREEQGGVAEEQREVITHRRVPVALMMTPFNGGLKYKLDWIICATMYKNKLYLMEVANDNRGDPIENPSSTHHFKFKQYCFSDSPHGVPDTKSPIAEGLGVHCIYRSRQHNVHLLYSGEIDGLISDKEIKVSNLEELNKCRFVQTRVLHNAIPDWWKNFRMLRWWAKCYLAAVNDIYMGRKCNESLIKGPVHHVVVNRLAQKQRWSPAVCLNFMYTFINYIFDEMAEINCPYTCYEFHFDSQENCVNLKIHPGKTEKSFLSDEYIDFITKS